MRLPTSPSGSQGHRSILRIRVRCTFSRRTNHQRKNRSLLVRGQKARNCFLSRAGRMYVTIVLLAAMHFFQLIDPPASPLSGSLRRRSIVGIEIRRICRKVFSPALESQCTPNYFLYKSLWMYATILLLVAMHFSRRTIENIPRA